MRRNILLTFAFWNLLKMRYHVSEASGHHRKVRREYGVIFANLNLLSRRNRESKASGLHWVGGKGGGGCCAGQTRKGAMKMCQVEDIPTPQFSQLDVLACWLGDITWFHPCVLQVWSEVGQKTWGLRSKLPPPAHTAINYVINWFQTAR